MKTPHSDKSLKSSKFVSAAKVLYIVGVSRSGSTILDIVLGNHSKICSVGELCNLVRRGVRNREYCSCGTAVPDCQFWRSVIEIWEKMTGRSISSLLDVQERFERFRTWPRLWSRVDRPTEELLTYWQLTAYLYEAIHRTAGKPIIVDSSKSSTRAFALVCNPFVDSRVLHLVRDGRGYVWSMRKAFKADLRRGVQHNMPAISSWRSSGRWVLGNVTSEVVTRRAPLNARRMKYEDLLADPASFFAGIGDLIDVDVSEVVEKLKEGSSLKTSHVVAGNRVRMAEKVIFKPDLAWRENLSKWDEVIFWIIGGLLAIKYGYHVDGARTG